MAHFAKLENGIVTQVIVISDYYEATGQEFINNTLGLEGTWLQTSYNTQNGVHTNGGTPLRGNYAGVGFTYDEALDAFLPPKPFESWILNEECYCWEAPKAYPDDGARYNWDEDSQDWIEVTDE